jgi:hypothetical protein
MLPESSTSAHAASQKEILSALTDDISKAFEGLFK